MPGPKNRFPGPGEAERGDIHGVVGVYFYPPPCGTAGFHPRILYSPPMNGRSPSVNAHSSSMNVRPSADEYRMLRDGCEKVSSRGGKGYGPAHEIYYAGTLRKIKKRGKFVRKKLEINAMSDQEVILSEHIGDTLPAAIGRTAHDRLFVLTDETTLRLCWPLVAGLPCMAGARMITIGATDEHKTLESLAHVWRSLQEGGATRHSLMVCLGGGMVTDLGGFAASTFKRGIAYINVPTTLLAMVDAAVGGKTGINFGGLKNEVGVFNCARTVILDAGFLRTLDRANLCSGYAEMLKHGLISDVATWAGLLRFDLDRIDYAALGRMVAVSVGVKERIVREDPLEQGLRKALNLGHTVGHAFESLALAENRTVLHGYAVAWGLVCELYLSTRRLGFPKERLRQTLDFVRENYGVFAFGCNRYDTLYELMTHDKKNTAGRVNFTLLSDIGDLHIDQTATRDEITDMLDFYREA